MFDWEKVYRNGEEYSFEEIRVRSLGLLGKEWRGEVKDWEMEWHAPGCELSLSQPNGQS
jgi:checkpoint serine/threonine-protein kinase